MLLFFLPYYLYRMLEGFTLFDSKIMWLRVLVAFTVLERGENMLE